MRKDPRPTTLPEFVAAVESEVDSTMRARGMTGWMQATRGGGRCARAGVCGVRAVVLALAMMLAGGCYEVPVATWVLDEHARGYGVRVEVVATGEFSSALLLPVPADRRRVEALPGDTVSFALLAADTASVLGNDALDPAFWVCAGCRSFVPGGAPVTCDGTLATLLDGCLVGRGADVQLTLPTDVDAGELVLVQSPRVVAIAGVPGETTTDACIDAYFAARRDESLRQCVLASNQLALGPWWLLAPLLSPDLQSTQVLVEHPELALQVPDFNPEVERFAVFMGPSLTGGYGLHDAGEVVAAPTGQVVTLVFDADPRDAQRWVAVDSEGNSVDQRQFVLTRWFASMPLDGVTSASSPEFSFRTPSEPASLRLDVVAWDGRAGLAVGSLDFDVRDAAP